MGVLLANQVAGTLATSASSASTSMVLALATNSTSLPSLGGSDWYYLTIIDQGSYAGQVSPPAKREIVKVTAASGNTITAMLRGQDGTTPQDWAAGDRVELRLCNAALVDFMSVTSVLSGTYQPTITNVSNLTGLSASPAQYQGNNQIITVSGWTQFTVTNAGVATEFSLTLPIAGTVSADTCRGTAVTINAGNGSTAETGVVYGNGATANVKWYPNLGTKTYNMTYIFTALIQ